MMNLLNYRAAIFDLDGTLVISEPAWQAAKSSVSARFGHSVSSAFLGSHEGRNVTAFVDEVFDKYDDERRAEVVSEIKSEAWRLLPSELRPIPGAQEFVRALSQQGLRLAICSSSPSRNIDLSLKVAGIEDLFDIRVSADGMKRGKPHPAPYLGTLENLALPADQVIVFEDSLAGARSAVDAGLTTVGIGPNLPSEQFGFCAIQVPDYETLLSSMDPGRRLR